MMSILVIVEHDNSAVNAATLNTVAAAQAVGGDIDALCLLYTSPSPRDATLSRMPSSA